MTRSRYDWLLGAICGLLLGAVGAWALADSLTAGELVIWLGAGFVLGAVFHRAIVALFDVLAIFPWG